MRSRLCAWQKAVIVCTLGVLSACSILPESPARDNYRLPVTSLAAPAHGQTAVDWSLTVATPHSGRLLDGLGILVVPQDNQIKVYKGAQWSDPAPILVRDRILDAVRANGRITSVSNAAANLKSDVTLQSDLRSFQVEYRENRPFVHIQLDAELVATATRRMLNARSFSVTLPAKGEQVSDIVAAFGKATDQLALDVVKWTVLQAKP